MSQAHIGDTGTTGAGQFDLMAYVGIARRRWFLFLLTAVIVFAAAYWYAVKLPAVYQATATILVQSQQIPTSLAQSTVTADADERIQVIEQRLMTRDNLLAIARKYNLYSDQPGRAPSDIVGLTKQATSIQQIDVGSQVAAGTSAIGFTVSFTSNDPGAAANVANELVTSILQQNVQSRTAQADETSKFFDQQITQLQSDLAAKEAQIADFKNQNQDSLPETFASRQSLLAQLQSQMTDDHGRIATLQSQRQLFVTQDSAPLSAGAPGSDSPAAQLALLRAQLVQLRAVYSDTHPEVRAVLAKIDALQKAVTASSADAAAAAAGAASNAPNGTSATSANGAQSGASPSDAVAAAVAQDPRINDIDNQVAALNSQLADIQQRSASLDASLQKTPQVEVALNVLTRDYQTLQTQYSAAQAKASEADTGQQLEQNQQAERFEVLEQATVPSAPIAPDRKRLMLAGGFGAVIAGAAMAAAAEFFTQSIRTAADMEKQLQIRPIVSIPYVTTLGERRRRRWRRITIPIGALLLLFLGIGVLQLYSSPLELIAQKVTSHLKF